MSKGSSAPPEPGGPWCQIVECSTAFEYVAVSRRGDGPSAWRVVGHPVKGYCSGSTIDAAAAVWLKLAALGRSPTTNELEAFRAEAEQLWGVKLDDGPTIPY